MLSQYGCDAVTTRMWHLHSTDVTLSQLGCEAIKVRVYPLKIRTSLPSATSSSRQKPPKRGCSKWKNTNILSFWTKWRISKSTIGVLKSFTTFRMTLHFDYTFLFWDGLASIQPKQGFLHTKVMLWPEGKSEDRALASPVQRLTPCHTSTFTSHFSIPTLPCTSRKSHTSKIFCPNWLSFYSFSLTFAWLFW